MVLEWCGSAHRAAADHLDPWLRLRVGPASLAAGYLSEIGANGMFSYSCGKKVHKADEMCADLPFVRLDSSRRYTRHCAYHASTSRRKKGKGFQTLTASATEASDCSSSAANRSISCQETLPRCPRDNVGAAGGDLEDERGCRNDVARLCPESQLLDAEG